MSRISNIIEVLSNVAQSRKTIPMIASVCILGRIAYCALGDEKADNDREQIRHSAPRLQKEGRKLDYRKLLNSADQNLLPRRCRASLSLYSTWNRNLITTYPDSSCRFAQERLLSALKNRETDDYERTRSHVSLAITTRGIFSKKTQLEFNGADLTVEQAVVVTTAVLS
ncbi:MAG: hypothetical protein JSR33_02910 [Proteobacteria bacterium]|nr:hypothetical protein [Pseudomonadota bacterium]